VASIYGAPNLLKGFADPNLGILRGNQAAVLYSLSDLEHCHGGA
jgi:hypothetical protein